MRGETASSWERAAQGHPVARRLLPWAEALLDAAEVSRTCGLASQADDLEDRVRRRLESVLAKGPVQADLPALSASWSGRDLPSAPGEDREERLWRKVRDLRVHRMPFSGQGHPREQGLAWGPYNQQSAVAEALAGLAGADPLRVDDLLEREKAMRCIDLLLGAG